MIERERITVVVADDEPEVIEYLRIVLDLEGFDLVGTASDAAATIGLVAELLPDVALIDLEMPGGGLEAAQQIRRIHPGTHIVIFSAATISMGILPLLSAGIDGYVVKGGSPDVLTEAIHSAVGGGAYLSPAVNRVALQELSTRLNLEEDMRVRRSVRRDRIARLIAESQFRVVLQPIIDLRDGQPHGVEALTRFTAAPAQSPDVWFGEADRVGEGPTLELATAASALHFLDELHSGLCMTINVSPATVLSGRLAEILESVDLSRVILEVTEHSAVVDYATLSRALAPWRERGLSLAVDDAGSGYASFAHILNISPEYIKLDISLVQNIDRDPHRQALARAICGFADELGVIVIAEGIENEAELAVVAQLGTPLAQGYHLGRPLPLGEQPSLLRSMPVPVARTEVDLRDRVGASGASARLPASPSLSRS
ncbi:MAG: EAL domain-containing protein [Acidimicrobiales bacterium]